jgi:hypothetical protein
MSRMRTRMNNFAQVACGVVLLVLAPAGSTAAAGAEDSPCRPRHYIDPQLTSELTGVYELSDGELLRVSRRVNRYYADMPATGYVEIVPVEQDVFVERNGPVRLTFAREAFATDVVVSGLDGRASGPPACPR